MRGCLKFIKHVVQKLSLSKLYCEEDKLCISLICVSTKLHCSKFGKTLCSISSIIRVESRIEEFYRIPFNTIGDSYENKKRIGWTDSKRTDARDDGAWQKRRRAKFGRQGDGGKAKSNLIHTISSRRIGGPCNRVRIVGTSFWRVGRTWQNILHFRDEVSCDCNFATTFISR